MRTAAMRTRELGSARELATRVGEILPIPSRVQMACMRVSSFLFVLASFWSAGMTDARSLRRMMSFCAVSRHQPFGCER